MVTGHLNRNFSFPLIAIFLSAFVCVYPSFRDSSLFAQDKPDPEIAVNLTEGRVVICATKDAIVLAAADVRGERGSRPPAITVLSAERMAVMMGAVEWVQPDSKDKPIQLDNEFRGLVAAALNTGNQKAGEFHTTDIEAIGIAVLERLRAVAGLLHHKINIGEDEPLIRIVLAGYLRDYGPEAWTIDYHIRQDALGNDIWRTRVLRPSYNQLYPPEKGKPKTFMEVRYPPENRAAGDPELLDLLQQNDSRLAKIRAASEIQAKAVTLAAEGQSQKADAASVVNFMKSGLPAVLAPQTKLTMAKVEYDGGFQWILQPPKAPAPPPGEKPKEKQPEEPERPTLRHKSED